MAKVPALQELDQLPVAAKWYRLGLYLGVSDDDLDIIENNYPRDVNMCKIKMFAEWLRGGTNPTYEKLVRALAAVGKRKLAESVCSDQGISQSVLDSTNTKTMHQSHEEMESEAVTVARLKIGKLQNKYEQLVTKTQETVQAKSITLTEFRTKITLGLPEPTKSELKPTLMEVLGFIYAAKSIDEIFGIFNLCIWDFLNFGLLQHLVEVYGDDELQQRMLKYSTSLESFRKRTTLKVFWKAHPATKECPEISAKLRESLKPITFKHGNLDETTSLEDIERFRQDLARQYSFPDFTIILADIEKGCVATTWLVPPSLAAKLEDETKRGNVSFLEQHNILELKIQDSAVYHSGGHSQTEGSIPEISFSDLEFGDQLGEGAFGVVYRGHWKSRDMDVAIKRVPGKINKTEIEILNKLKHPCIIQFHGVTTDRPGPPEHYIITELAEGGSLYDLLHKKNYQPSQEESLRWAEQIAQGMKYLHQMKMIHRDLKSSNVLLTGERNIKICDFGGAKHFDHTTKQTQTGTYRWMAPEMMKGEPVSLSSDVFSYGMLLYEILTGELPFSDAKTEMVIINKIMSGEVPPIPDSMEPYFAIMVKQCWRTNPKVRPSFYRILEILTNKGTGIARLEAMATAEDISHGVPREKLDSPITDIQIAQPAYMTRVEDICQGIPSERLDSPVTDIQIADLAFELKMWEELAPYLGLTEAEEEEIQVDYQGRYGLQKRQALQKWQSKLGRGPNGATYRNLIIALCRAKERDVAARVRNLLTEPAHVLETFRKYLVDCYTIRQHPAQTQWPFSRLSSYINLTLVHAPDTQMPPSGQEKRAQPLKEVQLTELFHIGSHHRQASMKVVLIEGPAGCGKTTLSWHVCREWAAGRLFQRFSLLIHISLEDQHVHSANCLADTIPHESSEMRQSVAKAISKQDGRGVCFLFDAWDEAPRVLQNYLLKFISTKPLPRCSIVVTSRPVATSPYHYLTAHVNIRGFGATELTEFIHASLEDRDSRQKLLQQLRENPQVNDLCNLPLNVAIVVHLFHHLSCSTLPSTRTGLFKALVCNLLLRHMQLRTHHGLLEVVIEFEHLPDDVLQNFYSVCGLAFHGIMEDRKVFLLDSLQKLGLKHPSSPLGLMQTQQLLTGFGSRHCYSFLHYAVQEFLAAYHISKLSEEEQTKSVGQILHSTPLSTVLPFYAGLTGLSNEGACGTLLEVTKQPLDTFAVRLALRHTLHESSDRRRLLLALLNCIYEAQNPSICKLVNPPLHPIYKVMCDELGVSLKVSMSTCNISFSHLGLDAVDCLAIGYFIYNKCLLSKKLLYVDLGHCCIGDTEVEILIKHIRKLRSSKARVALSLQYNTLSHRAMSAISDTLIQTSALQDIDLSNCLHPATTDIESALKYLIEGVSRNTSLEGLKIGDCSLGPAHAYHLALLATVCNTTTLVLSQNNIRSAIPFIAEATKHNRAIKNLGLTGCYICDTELMLIGGALQQNDDIHHLNIDENLFTSSALSQFLNRLIGTNSRLHLLAIDCPLTDVQRHTIVLINYTRRWQSLPPLQVTDMAFTKMTASEATDSVTSAPPNIRSRFAFRETI